MGFKIKGELLERYTPDAPPEKTVAVPSGIKRIAQRAFYECPAEEVILANGIYYIGEGAFSNSSVKRIILPNSVITLCEGAFLGCDSLEYAEIPKSVEEVRRDTFWSCFRMKKCRIQEGVRKIDPSAFAQCRNAFEIVNGEYRVTVPFVSDWAMSSASKCVELIAALGTDSAERLFAAIEREDHKLPLAVYCYVVHGSSAAEDFLSVRMYAAVKLMINDGDNNAMLQGLLKLGGLTGCRELFEAAETAGAEKCAALLAPLAEEEKKAEEAAAEQEQSRKSAGASEPEEDMAPPMPTVIVSGTDDGEDLDFAPTIEVFRRVTVDSAVIYGLKDRLELYSRPKNGFECCFDTDYSTLVITVTNPALIGESKRALIYRAFFGAEAPESISRARPERRILDLDIEKETAGEAADVIKTLLSDTDIIEASEIIDEWSVPVSDPASARQAVPAGATHEHCIYRNGTLEFYELFSWNVRVAVFEGGTITEICDGADCEWDNRSLRMFIDSLPEVYRVDRIAVKKPDVLRLPYTCHTLLAGSLALSSLKKLTLCRKQMSIGSNVINKKLEVVGVSDGTAQMLTEEADGRFTAGFGAMRGAGRVFPSQSWSILAPEESLWHGDSDYMSPMLEFVNCSGAASGKTLGITFIEETVKNAAEKGLEKLLDSKGLFYSLYRDTEKRYEIGLGIEIYVFRFGEISGLTAATYYINGYVIADNSVTTVLTSYVGTPDEAVAAVGTVMELMRTIEFADGVTPELADVDVAGLAAQLKERAEQAAAADKASAGDPSRVVVSGDWAVTVPKGYVWSVDPEVIRGQRCLLILNGGEGGDISSYYGATESYSCMSSQGPICSGDLREYCNKMRIRKLGLMSFGNGSPERRFVLKHTSEVAVFVQLQEYKGSSPAENGGANAVFRAEIITQNGVYPMQAVFGEEADLVQHENRLAELLMSVTDKDKVCNDTYMRCFFGLNASLRRVKPAKEETAAHYLELRSAEEGFDSWLRMGIQLRDSIEYALRAVEEISVPPFGYSETAWQYAGVFAVDSAIYDPKLDREQEIKHCYIREPEYLTAFRSFAWLIGEQCDITGKKPAELASSVILAAAQLVESRGCFCYDETHFPSICALPDLKVIYTPDGVSDPKVDRLIDQGDWHGASLDLLRSELAELKPCIDIIYDYLSKNLDGSKLLRGIHSDILYVWCSLTIAANRAFALTTEAPVSCDFGERTELSFADFEPQVFIEADLGSALGEAASADSGETAGEEQEPEIKSLICGERLSVEDYAGGQFVIDTVYSSDDPEIEVDGYAFMLTANGKVRDDRGFIFFGQETAPDGSVMVDDDNSCRFTFELDKADEDIVNIVVVYAVYGDEPGQTLDKVRDMDIRFYSGEGQVMDFVPEPFNPVKSMAACEIYRHEGIWKLRAVGRGYKGSLRELCAEFGVEVEE